MGASRYVGRVGGLAVALGVGVAVFMGNGVAYADTDTDSSDQSSTTAKDTDSGTADADHPKIRIKLSRPDGVIGRRPLESVAAAVESLKTTTGVAGPRSAGTKHSVDTKHSEDVSSTESDDAASGTGAKSLNAVTAHTVVRRKPADPKSDVVARVATTPALTDDAPATSVPRFTGLRAVLGHIDTLVESRANAVAQNTTIKPVVTQAPLTTTPQAPPQPPRVLAAFVDAVLNPFAGTSPISPTAPTAPSAPTSPASLILLAGTRREVSTQQAPAAANIAVVDGVIRGTTPTTLTSQNLTYTVIDAPSGGGKVNVDATTGKFTYLPYATGMADDGSPIFGAGPETFTVLVATQSPLDSALEKIPGAKTLLQPILVRLHQIPILGQLLSPIIGRSETVTITVDDAALAASVPGPIAFTTTVVSFDETPISVNWFPALNVPAGQTVAPTILNGPSLATAGYTNPDQTDTVFGLVPGLKPLRDAGYNVVTWDPRGEYASGGVLQLDSPDFEAQDVKAIITWVAEQPTTQFDWADATDPRIGMVGGSYGGGIQLTSAGVDPRIDAIAPGIAWNNLVTTLYPNHAFKTSFSGLLLASLVVSGSRINPQIYYGIATGAAFGFLTQAQQDFLNSSSPSRVVQNIQIPTLLLQGTVDTLFPLNQAITNAEVIGADNPDVKMVWYCGGHGQCLDPVESAKQTAFLKKQTIAWMDAYVKNMGPDEADSLPNFQWVDQKGDLYSSEDLPIAGSGLWDKSEPIKVTDTNSRVLPLVPVIGGSGPQTEAKFPVSAALAAEAENAINIKVPNPEKGNLNGKTYVVGSPTLTFTYSGVGTSRNVYAQLVDTRTGRVVGNIVTPVPVTLDGKENPVTVSMENIAFTMDDADSLVLQITSSATSYEDLAAYGVVRISNVTLSLPTVDSDNVHFEESLTGVPAVPTELLGV